MSSNGPVSDLQAMLAGMDPALDLVPYQFVSLRPEDGLSAVSEHPFAMINEEEGMTLVVRSDELKLGGPIVAEQAGLPTIPPASATDLSSCSDRFARITLQVRSDLNAVGLTAAVASALAAENIACNVVAGFQHDHLFVPWQQRQEAMNVLGALQDDARR